MFALSVVTHTEVYDAAIVAAVGAVVAAGVSAMALVTTRGNRSRINAQDQATGEAATAARLAAGTAEEARNSSEDAMRLLVDIQHQHGERLDHIADRTDQAIEQLTILGVQSVQKARSLDELMVRTFQIETRLAEHIARYDKHVVETEPLIEFVRTLMGKEGGE